MNKGLIVLTILLMLGIGLIEHLNLNNVSMKERIEIVMSNQTSQTNQKLYYTVKNIGDVNIEEIVYNGLIAEMGYSNFEMEAYKAQAVAIRTYIISNKKHKGTGYDVCGTTCCFVLADDKKKAGFSKKQLDRYKQAVEETKGEVIYYNNKIIDSPLFFAYGHRTTNTPKDVWGSDNRKYPYLKSVDTLEAVKPQTITMPKSVFLEKLNIYDFSDFIVEKVKVENGYLRAVDINGDIYNGNQLRGKLGLKSGSFEVFNDGDNVIITSYGFGHGVGMSQYGANEYAKIGYNYIEILKHYYKGVEVRKWI